MGSATFTYAYGAEAGINYIDVILTGTPGASGAFVLVCSGSGTGASPSGPLPAYPSTNYQFGANVKLQAGTWSNVVPTLSFQEHNPNTGLIRVDQFTIGERTDSLDLDRYSGSIVTASNCLLIHAQLYLAFAAASAISLTVRFGNPTLQQDDGLQSGGAPRMMTWY